MVIAPEIFVPSVIAAAAMPVPIIARINAYSAADAPLSSRRNDVTNLTIINTPYLM